MFNIILLDCIIDLFEEGFDMVICISIFGDSCMVVWLLVLVCMIVCVLLVFLQWCGMLVSLVELCDYFFIFYSYCNGGDEWYFKYEYGDICMVCVCFIVYVNNGVICCVMVMVGQGIVIQLDFIVNVVIQFGELVELFEGWSIGE